MADVQSPAIAEEPEAPTGAPRSADLDALVVDDERNIRTTLVVCLESLGCRATAVATGDAALAALDQRPFDLAFLDLRLGSASGLDLIPRLLAARPGLAVVVITAYATVDTAVEAIRRGAIDYVPKPFTPAQIRLCVEQVAARRRLAGRVSELERRLAEILPDVDLETASPAMRAVLDVIEKAARSDAPVLLTGESGTGKGILAQVLHARSARASRPFVVVNCPTLSEELLASELFGHARGAFTGAVRDQAGRVESAQGGTLFLDEIGEISPGLQAKLLRFLQEKRFERIGESRTREADVRVVAATNRDLERDVRDGRFREDLLYRLNVIEVTVPPLRARPEDLLRLANGFLRFFARGERAQAPVLSKAAEAALLAYAWPGNVRELRNAMERAVILWPSAVLEPEAFASRIAGGAASGSATGAAGAAGAAGAPHADTGVSVARATGDSPDAGSAGVRPALGGDFTLAQLEEEHIRRVIERAATLEEAARILGIESSTLWRKRKKLEP